MENTILVKFPGNPDPVEIKLQTGAVFNLPVGAKIVSKEPQLLWVDELLSKVIAEREKQELNARLSSLPDFARQTLVELKASFRHAIGEGDRVGTIEESSKFNSRYRELIDFLSMVYAYQRQGKSEEDIKSILNERYPHIFDSGSVS